MSFRVKAIAAAAAAACLLLAPAAMASSRGLVQVTGKQLKSALLPGSDFGPGPILSETDTGGRLEHGALFNLHSMPCQAFWPDIGIVPGFGDTAFAFEVITSSSVSSGPRLFEQSVYQFASTVAASSFFAELNAKYRSCSSVTVSDPNGRFQWTVRSQSKQHVGGHQALQLAENVTKLKTSAPPSKIDVLWTLDGTDVCMNNATLFNTSSPQPSLSSLTLKLIARVGALR
jgi:hypothetical protein